jgi:hypothetical protein
MRTCVVVSFFTTSPGWVGYPLALAAHFFGATMIVYSLLYLPVLLSLLLAIPGFALTLLRAGYVSICARRVRWLWMLGAHGLFLAATTYEVLLVAAGV